MKYLNAFGRIQGIGSQKIRILIRHFGSAKSAWEAPEEELRKSGIGEKFSERIAIQRASINLENEWNALETEKVRMITEEDDGYPALLREIHNPPLFLYVKSESEFNFNDHPMISVVGSRKFTNYGRQVAYSLARDLAQAGVTVVSGMALGIDAFAHQGALDGGGKTIAVLGSGLDDKNIGPRTNFNLSRKIISRGALVSDYPLDTPASPGTFPARNRIMAGLSSGTVVVEATEASGTLITANLAVEFSREVFAVPGEIFSANSQGPNSLIKSGAKLVTSANDILEELNLQNTKISEKVRKIIPDSKEEALVLKILSQEPTHIDRILKLTKLGINVASSTLSIMEIKGMVKDMGGKNYIAL